MIGPLDHIALTVCDLDDAIRLFIGGLGFRLRRRGVHAVTGGRIALLDAPGGGVKLELIEQPGESSLDHVALRVDDVREAAARLESDGLIPLSGPFYIEAAMAESALLRARDGVCVQLIRYDPQSPDL